MIDKEAVRIRRLIRSIGKDIVTRQGLMSELDLSKAAIRNFRDNYLNPARAQGLVTMSKPTSPNSPEQAYKLTPKGLDFLNMLLSSSSASTKNSLVLLGPSHY